MSAATLRFTALLSALPLLGLFGCEEVPNDAEIADLSDAEARILCEELAAEFPVEQSQCDFRGVSRTVEVGFEETVDACMREVAQRPETCQATVGKMRGCYAALYDMQGTADACSDTPEPTPIYCYYLFDPSCADTDVN